MEIDMRRMKLIRLYCDRPENIRDCLKASETTHIKYNGKDDRNYNPQHIKEELKFFSQSKKHYIQSSAPIGNKICRQKYRNVPYRSSLLL